VPDSYHHGDLRRAVLDRAVNVIRTSGPEGFSLRSLAADLGVSHTAPRHHFGDRRGVLTAIAAEGFERLADALATVRREGGPFLEQGVAYVEFAETHPAHFQVMFAPALLDDEDDALDTARAATFAELRAGVDTMSDGPDQRDAAAAVIAAWALVHGIATLGASGNLDASDLRALVGGGDLAEITRRSAALLGGSPSPRPASAGDGASPPGERL
jgi:AcrR family transcriptional regulator